MMSFFRACLGIPENPPISAETISERNRAKELKEGFTLFNQSAGLMPLGLQKLMMEYEKNCKETALETLLGKGTPFPDDVRLQILYDIALELAALKKSAATTKPENGVLLHRNLKAENILITDNWKALSEVKQSQTNPQPIARLGFKGAEEQAYILNTLKEFKPNIRVRIIASLSDTYYSPPEGWTTLYNPAADMYRFGLLCFETWVGLPWKLFNWEDREGITGPYRKPPAHAIPLWRATYKDRFMSVAGCPRELYNFIQRCWDIDPTKRPTIDEALATLKQLICPHQIAKPHLKN